MNIRLPAAGPPTVHAGLWAIQCGARARHSDAAASAAAASTLERTAVETQSRSNGSMEHCIESQYIYELEAKVSVEQHARAS